MSIKFQFNKTSLQELKKQLVVRERALPTLKNKEAALRVEVKKAKDLYEAKIIELENAIARYDKMKRMWTEFDSSFIQIDDVELSSRKVAGTRVAVLEKVLFNVKEFSVAAYPTWFLEGIEILKQLSILGIEQEVLKKNVDILHTARRKTTQKVNLFEKVQIPGYKESIRKIKRFLEDEENISKSSQKIVKKRQEMSLVEDAK